jgi:hypothetical protein
MNAQEKWKMLRRHLKAGYYLPQYTQEVFADMRAYRREAALERQLAAAQRRIDGLLIVRDACINTMTDTQLAIAQIEINQAVRARNEPPKNERRKGNDEYHYHSQSKGRAS